MSREISSEEMRMILEGIVIPDTVMEEPVLVAETPNVPVATSLHKEHRKALHVLNADDPDYDESANQDLLEMEEVITWENNLKKRLESSDDVIGPSLIREAVEKFSIDDFTATKLLTSYPSSTNKEQLERVIGLIDTEGRLDNGITNSLVTNTEYFLESFNAMVTSLETPNVHGLKLTDRINNLLSKLEEMQSRLYISTNETVDVVNMPFDVLKTKMVNGSMSSELERLIDVFGGAGFSYVNIKNALQGTLELLDSFTRETHILNEVFESSETGKADYYKNRFKVSAAVHSFNMLNILFLENDLCALAEEVFFHQY